MEGAKETKDEQMEFSDEVDSNSDEDRHDDDLLKMQKQKSIPMVAVTEFVDDDEEVKSEEKVPVKHPLMKQNTKEVLKVEVASVSKMALS